MKGSRAVSGIAFIALYVVVASLTFRSDIFPVRPLYDGNHGGPVNYRWVTPPPGVAPTAPAEGGTHRIAFTEKGSQAGSFTSKDGQSYFYYPPNVFERVEGQTAVRLLVEPLDPALFGEPPDGFVYDGNAYRFTASYEPSREPARLAAQTCDSGLCPSFGVTAALGVKALFRRDGDKWTRLVTEPFPKSSIISPSAVMGVFVGGHDPGTKSNKWNLITFGLGLAAIMGATMIAARRARTRDARARRKKQSARARAKKKARSVKRWLRSG